MKYRIGSKGFTIIELLISTVVFSVVLLVLTAAVIQFGKVYYKGVIVARTNEVSRDIADDVTKSVQYSGSRQAVTINPGSPTDPWVICAGSRRYTFFKNTQLGTNNHVLVADKIDNGSACTVNAAIFTAGALPAGNSELLGERMRVINFEATEDAATSLVTTKLRIAYGDDQELQDNDGDGLADGCTSVSIGGQFCAVSELTTFASRRLN